MKDNIDIFNSEIERYFLDGGDEELRYNYSLNDKSIVFDVGGYVGDFTSFLYDKFKSKIYLFEPVGSYYDICSERFRLIEKIEVKKQAIGSSNSKSKIFINGDMTSSNISSDNFEVVEIKTLKNTMDILGIERIDLLKLNIEGDEYGLLNRAIKDKYMDKISNIQVQYHMNVDNYEEKKYKITKELEKTHILEWKYEWVWESWKIK